jgi:hypothetical protein
MAMARIGYLWQPSLLDEHREALTSAYSFSMPHPLEPATLLKRQTAFL